MAKILPKRFIEFRTKLHLTQDEMASKLGIGGKYVGMIERDKKDVDDESSLGKLFLILESSPLYDSEGHEAEVENQDEEKPSEGEHCHCDAKSIPVISWAHAGEAESYDELPKDWQDHLCADIGDEDGFAVRLRGDSMEPRYYEGDVLLISPSRRPYNGGLVVCKFKSDGIIFRQIEVIDKTIRLVPINARYPATEHEEADFHWIYPVVEMRRNVWK